MPHGKICYLEIPANRAEDSARFYSDIFGWKVRERGDGNLVFDDTGGVSGRGSKKVTERPMSALALTSWSTALPSRCSRLKALVVR
jgi:predicted enzyme related to lactoylglutathione lyase